MCLASMLSKATRCSEPPARGWTQPGKTVAVLKPSSLVQTVGFIIVGPDLCQCVHTLSDAVSLYDYSKGFIRVYSKGFIIS